VAASQEDCASPPGDPESLTLSVNSSATVASGLSVHFAGVTRDHYDDGRFDVLAEVRFAWADQSASEIVSALAKPAFRPILGHCWRLKDGGDEGVVVEVSMTADATSLATCEASAEAVPPVLEDYAEIAVGTPFRATLRYDDGSHQWQVDPQPKILLHHATRIDWKNLAEFGGRGLGLARGSEVHAVFHIVESKVEHIPSRNQWLSEHIAVLDSACLPP